jgi:hypothetical protein
MKVLKLIKHITLSSFQDNATSFGQKLRQIGEGNDIFGISTQL